MAAGLGGAAIPRDTPLRQAAVVPAPQLRSDPAPREPVPVLPRRPVSDASLPHSIAPDAPPLEVRIRPVDPVPTPSDERFAGATMPTDRLPRRLRPTRRGPVAAVTRTPSIRATPPTAPPVPATAAALAPPPPLIKPVPLASNRAPHYPHLAHRRRLAGVVLLSIRVSAAGNVAGVDVARSSGHASLDRAAVDAAANWRYRPATRGNRTVEAMIRQPVRFAL